MMQEYSFESSCISERIKELSGVSPDIAKAFEREEGSFSAIDRLAKLRESLPVMQHLMGALTTQHPAIQSLLESMEDERNQYNRLADQWKIPQVDFHTIDRGIIPQYYVTSASETQIDDKTIISPYSNDSNQETFETLVKNYATSPRNIILLGERGTGKSYTAKCIHELAKLLGNFEVYSCAYASDPTRMQSDLFGHTKGSFTGAIEDRKGLATTAQNGTLFLDEIGDIDNSVQATLLTFLQEDSEGKKTITPVGGKSAKINVRVIAAMNKPFDTLRNDLQDRFPLQIVIPSLKMRKSIIPELALAFFKKHKESSPNKKSMEFLKREADALSQSDYDWPGNIRQLDNAILQAVLCKTIRGNDNAITAEDILAQASK